MKMKKNGRADGAPRMTLVRRARTKIRRGDYSGPLAREVLDAIARELLADLASPR